MSEKALVLVIIILSIGISGIFSFSMAEHESVHTCPVSTILGGECPSTNNIVLGLHHITGLQSLMQVVQSSHNAILILYLLLLSSFVLIIYGLLVSIKTARSFFSYLKKADRTGSSFQKQRRWFALRNKRDSFAPRGAY